MQGTLLGAVGIDAQDMASALRRHSLEKNKLSFLVSPLLHTTDHQNPKASSSSLDTFGYDPLAPASVPIASSLNSHRGNAH